MSTPRSLQSVRSLVLAATAAFVIGVPAIALAERSTPAATHAKATVGERRFKGDAAGEKRESEERMQKMTTRLKLTNDQVAKVQAIMQAKRTRMTELGARYKGQPETTENKAARMKARKELHADTDARIAQVLNASQMTEYNKMRAEHMKKGWEKGEKGEKDEKGEKGEKGEKDEQGEKEEGQH